MTKNQKRENHQSDAYLLFIFEIKNSAIAEITKSITSAYSPVFDVESVPRGVPQPCVH